MQMNGLAYFIAKQNNIFYVNLIRYVRLRTNDADSEPHCRTYDTVVPTWLGT